MSRREEGSAGPQTGETQAYATILLHPCWKGVMGKEEMKVEEVRGHLSIMDSTHISM